MNLKTYEAKTFLRPMARGQTRPFLVEAQSCDDDAGDVFLVVKPRAGYANRPDAIYKEIFSTLLAGKLGVLTPTPAIVNLPEGLEFGAEDYPESKKMIQNSIGLNYATIFLGSGWKTWTNGANPQSLSQSSIQSSFCLDALVQNSDRKLDNPNLMWKGDQLVTLDFDRSYEYGNYSLQQIMVMLDVKQHALHSSLNVPRDELIGQELWNAWEEWRLENPTSKLFDNNLASTPLHNITESDLSNMLNYIRDFDSDPEKLFGYLTALI